MMYGAAACAYSAFHSDVTRLCEPGHLLRLRIRSCSLCVACKMNLECFYLFKAWISFYIQSFPVQTIMNLSDIPSTKMAIIKGWWYSKWIVIRPHIYLTSPGSRFSRMAVILCRYTQRRSLLYFKYLPWCAQPKTFTLHSSPLAPLMCVFLESVSVITV